MIRKIGIIGKRYRHTNRYLEVIKVLTKYGYEDIVSQSKLESVLDFGKNLVFKTAGDKVDKYTRWERIRMVMEELGPTYIKFGQLLSTRPDLVPTELISELKKLQDAVPPFPEEQAVIVLEEELGKPINEVFKDYSSAPIAAASMAQVHKAILHSGEEVAIKIQRPGIDKIVETDLEIMLHLSMMMEKHIEGMESFNLNEIVHEFENAIRKELNFQNEARNLERFGNNFQNNETIYVPALYKEFCTRKVLTMEFIDGIKITDTEKILANSLDRSVIVKRGTDLILKQIFELGFFHADPHPGNILVLPENIICFLDFGMMGSLSQKTRELITSLMSGAINRDINKISRNVLRICETTGEINISKLELNLNEIIDRYYNQSLEDMDIAEMINDLVDFFPENNLRIPADLFLLGRALILLQSIGEELDEHFNVTAHIEPYIKKMLQKRLHGKKIALDVLTSSEEMLELAKELPFEIREILEKIRKGTLKTEIEHKGLNPMISKHEQISNRITFAIILASITIGSALVVHAKIPPYWNDIPIIGIVGFIAATILGFLLLFSIYRSGRI